MLASLTYIVAYHTRRLLIGPKGIPFGLLHGSDVVGSPGSLIKRPFWASFFRHWPFALLLIVVGAISLILGPSSAIMMIPSLGWFDLNDRFEGNSSTLYIWTGADIYTGAEHTELWPNVFNATVPFDETETDCGEASQLSEIQCPNGIHTAITEWASTSNIFSYNMY